MNASELIETFTKKIRIYDLEHERYIGMPAYEPVQPGLLYFLYRHHESYYKPEVAGPRSSSSGLIIMADQSGTHIDARCHQASDLTLPGGIKVTLDIETPWGFKKLGAEEIPPIVGRGVLIDVAAHTQDPLPEEYEIRLEEFLESMKKEGVEVRENDIVLVRTGYGKYWNEPEKYFKAAGISKEVSLWLAEKNVLAVASDNLAWDVPKYVDPETKSKLPGHLFLLAKKGVYIIENVNMEEISRDGVYEFLFIGLPLKFKGATGSPLRPIAVVPI